MTATTASAVFVAQDTDIDRDGDEIDVWHVYVGDDDAEAVGKVYTCWNADRAFELGRRMASDRRLELVVE